MQSEVSTIHHKTALWARLTTNPAPQCHSYGACSTYPLAHCSKDPHRGSCLFPPTIEHLLLTFTQKTVAVQKFFTIIVNPCGSAKLYCWIFLIVFFDRTDFNTENFTLFYQGKCKTELNSLSAAHRRWHQNRSQQQ